jgi:hypothetical protein
MPAVHAGVVTANAHCHDAGENTQQAAVISQQSRKAAQLLVLTSLLLQLCQLSRSNRAAS